MAKVLGPADVARLHYTESSKRFEIMIDLAGPPSHKWSYRPSHNYAPALLGVKSGKGRISHLNRDNAVDDYKLRAYSFLDPFVHNINKNIAQMNALRDFGMFNTQVINSLSGALEICKVPYGPSLSMRRFWIDAIFVMDGRLSIMAMDPRTGQSQLQGESLSMMLSLLHHYVISSDYRLSKFSVGVLKSKIIQNFSDCDDDPMEIRKLTPVFLDGSPCCSKEDAYKIVSEINSEFQEAQFVAERRRAANE